MVLKVIIMVRSNDYAAGEFELQWLTEKAVALESIGYSVEGAKD
jgi:hypothetical protein